jgi:hypothetical protein
MEEALRGEVAVAWRRRLMALYSNPKADYFARDVRDASYVSATGEYVPRVFVSHGYRVPTIDQYQFPIDNTPYRIAGVSPYLLNTYPGGPPVGWQPPHWTMVHEENPHCHVKFLGKAETPEPSAEVFDRAREWIAENASASDPLPC